MHKIIRPINVPRDDMQKRLNFALLDTDAIVYEYNDKIDNFDHTSFITWTPHQCSLTKYSLVKISMSSLNNKIVKVNANVKKNLFNFGKLWCTERMPI